MNTIESKIKVVIAEQLGVQIERIKPDADFSVDLGADSLDVVELIMALEEEFEIEIADDEAENLRTVKAVVDYVCARAA